MTGRIAAAAQLTISPARHASKQAGDPYRRQSVGSRKDTNERDSVFSLVKIFFVLAEVVLALVWLCVRGSFMETPGLCSPGPNS